MTRKEKIGKAISTVLNPPTEHVVNLSGVLAEKRNDKAYYEACELLAAEYVNQLDKVDES